MSMLEKSASDLLGDLASGALSAADLMDATLAQIADVNPTVNAIVALQDAERLRAQAAAADEATDRGPLHGLPIAVKDLVEVEGIVSTHGSPLFASHVPKTDDILAARLRAAGAILIGKTNVPEFGLGSHTFNPVYGATRNPYDLGRTCGGSSGGAAVALATGMLALADGSDMMGSLRNPAAWNNVYGLRPTYGVVPAEPKGDTFLKQMATLGPMARSPADIALLLDVIAGPDPRQPHGRDYTAISPVAPADLSGLRVGWLGDWGGAFPCEAGILDLCETGLQVFADLGAKVDPVAPPFSADAMWDSWITLRSFLTGAGLGPLTEKGIELKDSAMWEIGRYREMTAEHVHTASVKRSAWFETAARLFDTYDILVLPTAQAWPFDIDLPWPTEIEGTAMDTYHRWMQVTVPASLIGLPALAVPAGFGAAGLPMGMQLMARQGSDARLLAIGEAYHQATEWPQKRPPVL
ncbi:amidase [Chachezhania antarctica]|uniref:amidase n=1 Tax=Chachezhania antarctica TaxID=2340860 RepID=UPI000EAFD05E|nr:amidase [Chachezhania antarctica]